MLGHLATSRPLVRHCERACRPGLACSDGAQQCCYHVCGYTYLAALLTPPLLPQAEFWLLLCLALSYSVQGQGWVEGSAAASRGRPLVILHSCERDHWSNRPQQYVLRTAGWQH